MRNVLVFEKERIVCLDIKTIFSGSGFNVVFGHSIHELAGKGIEPVLVILDQLSYQLLEKENLWSYFGYAHPRQVPLIFSFSGTDHEAPIEIRREMNVIGKIAKPYDSNQLVEIYREYQRKQQAAEKKKMNPEEIFR